MGTAGCIVFSEALRSNTSLERVLLHGNPLGQAGGWHIMDAIISGTSVPYIGLAGANFFAAGVHGMAAELISTSAAFIRVSRVWRAPAMSGFGCKGAAP